MKPPNKAERSAAEAVEGRGRLEGNSLEQAKVRTQSRGVLPSSLQWVNEVAKRDRRCRFTALLHHVDEAALRRAFSRQKRSASAGVDGETVASYEGTSKTCANGCTRGAIDPSPFGGCISPSLMGARGPSVCRSWRTRSSRVRWPRSSVRSMRRTSSAFRTGSGRDDRGGWADRAALPRLGDARRIQEHVVRRPES